MATPYENIFNRFLKRIEDKDLPNVSEDAMNEYASPYHGMNLATFTKTERPNQAYPIFVNKETGVLVGVGKSLQQLIDGKIIITKDLALKLSTITNTSVELWQNLQKSYDKKQLKKGRK